METVTVEDLKTMYVAPRGSHKGQNGRLLVVGGSELFHAASLWALTVASRIVDLVHYSSVPENNELVAKTKEEFRNGIVVSRADIDSYIEEDDVILMGSGMMRDHETETLTNSLLKKYPNKQWVLDAGSLQMMDVALIPKNAILTPHHAEFETLWKRAEVAPIKSGLLALVDRVKLFASTYGCTVLLKGEKDIACPPTGGCRVIEGGNPGMTKGGTGDVLAGLVAALACKNDPFQAAIAGSFINKKAGDELFKTMGVYFNATDLADEIPRTMKTLLV